jgi:hypothetical protein
LETFGSTKVYVGFVSNPVQRSGERFLRGGDLASVFVCPIGEVEKTKSWAASNAQLAPKMPAMVRRARTANSGTSAFSAREPPNGYSQVEFFSARKTETSHSVTLMHSIAF